MQSSIFCKLDEMTHQDRTNSFSLPSIDDDKCHLSPSGLEDNISAASGNHLAVAFLCERDIAT